MSRLDEYLPSVRFIVLNVHEAILPDNAKRVTLALVNHLKNPITWGIALLIVAILFGEMFSLYYRFAWLDTAFHAIGGFLLAWYMWHWIASIAMPSYMRILIVLSLALAIGVIWEWAEYLSSFSRESIPTLYRYFHGGNLADTLKDLVADSLGALAYIAIRRGR